MSPLPPEHLAFDALPLAVLIVRAGQVVHANPAALRLLQIPLEQLLGVPTSEFISAEHIDRGDLRSVQAQREARSKGQGLDRYWLRLKRADGTGLTVQVHSLPGPRAEERTVLFVEATPEDAGAGMLTEALTSASWALVRLRDERAVLAAAADALEGQGLRVVILRLVENRFEHAELRQDPEAVAEVARRSGAPLTQQPIPRELAVEFDAALSQRRALFVQDTHAMVDRFRPPHVAEVIKRAMPRAAVVAPIVVEDQPYAVLTAHHDQLTPAAVDTIELFAHRVGGALENVRHHRRAEQRVQELNDLQKKLVLQERVATLGEAAAVMAHEVRNPVAAILNAVAVLKRSPPETGPVLAMVEEEALRLDRMVRDLLHLARPLQPKRVALELDRVVERAVGTVIARQAGTRAATIRPLTPSGVRIEGDSFLLALALENLIANAQRAAGPDGQVEISVRPAGSAAVVAVDDDGEGIAPEVAARLFEPFFTTHATGTGLGLAVVRRVAEAHRGVVRVGSGPLGGARFELELPASSE